MMNLDKVLQIKQIINEECGNIKLNTRNNFINDLFVVIGLMDIYKKRTGKPITQEGKEKKYEVLEFIESCFPLLKIMEFDTKASLSCLLEMAEELCNNPAAYEEVSLKEDEL